MVLEAMDMAELQVCEVERGVRKDECPSFPLTEQISYTSHDACLGVHVLQLTSSDDVPHTHTHAHTHLQGVAASIPIAIKGEAYKIEVEPKFPQVR